MVTLIERLINIMIGCVIFAIGGAIGLWIASYAIVWYVNSQPLDCSKVEPYGVIPKSCAHLAAPQPVNEGF